MKNWIKENSFVIFLIASGICTIFVYTNINDANKERLKNKKQKIEIIKVQSSLYDSIYNEILNLRIEHPNIVYSQVIHETDSLRSNLFRTNHNLFGMKCCGNRATTSNKVRNGYAYYTHWRESLLDYALLQMSHYKNLTDDEYYERLRLRYASDKQYVEKLKQYDKWQN